MTSSPITSRTKSCPVVGLGLFLPLLLLLLLLLRVTHVTSFGLDLARPTTPTETSTIHHHYSSNSFISDVTQWLDDANIPYQKAQLPVEITSLFPHRSKSIILELLGGNNNVTTTTTTTAVVALHLIPTPTSQEECHPPYLQKYLTNLVSSPTTTATPPPPPTTTTGVVISEGQEPNSMNKYSKIIHLHQDVWRNKPDIVQSRLLAQVDVRSLLSSSSSLSQQKHRRIYARSTISQRINATIAMEFLNTHHLWGATRAKYYYGLFLVDKKKKTTITNHNNKNDELVAVATFSSRRKIVRGDQQSFKSHELLRFCTQQHMTIIGGISKVLTSFIRDHNPDDIVTVVDRDWGDGSGWHSVGFHTVCTLDPLVMVVSSIPPRTDKDDDSGDDDDDDDTNRKKVRNLPVRRHLVGAGIRPENSDNSSGITNDPDRLGLSLDVLQELDSCDSAHDALQVLAHHNYFPVYDSGVERLMKVVHNNNKSNTNTTNSEVSASMALELWQNSIPSYAAKYYSDNTGIACLLQHAAVSTTPILQSPPSSSPLPPLLSKKDSNKNKDDDDAYLASWRATSLGSSSSSQLLFSAPSSMDLNAIVEVRERPNGWRTVGIKGGATKSIYHAIYKVNPRSGQVEPTAVINEYIKTMTAILFSTLGLLSDMPQVQSDTRPKSEDDSVTTTKESSSSKSLRILHFGLGAGTLLRLVAHHAPSCQQVAVEIDQGVIEALQILPGLPNTHVIQKDALEFWRSSTNSENDRIKEEEERFDCILIDVFDGYNLLPPEFYSIDFLTHIRENLLKPSGFVVHNFHSGGMKRNQVIHQAYQHYSKVFPSSDSTAATTTTTTAGGCFMVDTCDSKPNAGNTIILACKQPIISSMTDGENSIQDHLYRTLRNAASRAQIKWKLPFSVQWRVSDKL